MSIRLVGSATFQGQVLARMGEICPCREFEVDGNGFLQVGASSTCGCVHRVGCTLVQKLLDMDQVLTIVDASDGPGGDNIFAPDCGSAYDDQNHRIIYCTTQTLSSCFGQPPAIECVTLAHEMIHALLHCCFPGIPFRDEKIVVPAENQIRQEVRQPPRCCYGCVQVDWTSGMLPDDWQSPGAECNDLSDWLKEYSRRVIWLVRWKVVEYLASTGEHRRCWNPICAKAIPPSLVSGEGSIDEHISRAFRARAAHRDGSRIDEEIEALKGHPGDLAHVSAVVQGSDPRELLIHRYGNRITVLTNVGVGTGGRLVRLSALTRYVFEINPGDEPSQGSPNPIFPPSFPEGSGGRAQIVDGGVSLLLTRSGDERRGALYGLYQPVDSESGESPDSPEDLARRQAITELYELWMSLSKREPASIDGL
jgi:hypothetical protein